MPDNSVDLNGFQRAVQKRLENYSFTGSLPRISLHPELEGFRSNFISDRDLLRRAYLSTGRSSANEQSQFQALVKTLSNSSLNLVETCFTAQVDPFCSQRDLFHLNVEMKTVNEPVVVLVADVYGKSDERNDFEFDQEFLIHSKCSLTSLKDIFFCQKDFCPQRIEALTVNVSGTAGFCKRNLENLNVESGSLNPLLHLIDPSAVKKDCKSGFLFINGKTFCNDLRHEESVDYSAPIISWIAERAERRKRFPNISAVSMENCRFDNFNWKFNHPNIILHHGSCAHLLVLREIRCSRSIPSKEIVLSVQRKIKKRRCSVCDLIPAYWITFNDENVALNPCYFCEDCYREFHYDKQGNLVYENFEVYRYFYDD